MQSKESQKLRECPFCGSTLVVPISCWYVQCTRCKASSGAYGSKEKAIEAWNRRASDETV